jgi:hypothetical protein
MEVPVIAVYDANILYPAPLRDLFVRLAQNGLVQAKWTESIHDEWTRNVLLDNPRVTADRLARTRALMNDAVRDCLVTGYEDLIDTLVLPDPDDRHVLAAAVRAGAQIIVTRNLRDFPPDTLSRFDVEAQHPDAFIQALTELAPAVVCATVKQQQVSLRHPPRTIEELLATLEGHGLVQSVARLRQLDLT